MSNSWVKKRGSGVGVNSRVGVGSGVDEAGTGVGEAGTVAVRGRAGSGVDVAAWSLEGDRQAEVRRRSPMRRCFFMLLLRMTKRTALRQYVSGDAGN